VCKPRTGVHLAKFPIDAENHVFQALQFLRGRCLPRRSEWPRGLRHKLSSAARTLGS
jgi:hypothetical protein